MLSFMLDRLADLSADAVVIATSDLAQDDVIATLATDAGYAVARGSETDVLSRFVVALDLAPADTVIRLTSDCPLMDPRLVEQVLARHHKTGAAYTANTLPRTFPKGLDVEVMTADALRAAARDATDPDERQHVTPFLYRHPERFVLANLRNDELLGDEWWTVDTAQDLEFVRSVVAQLPDERASWRTILDVVGRRSHPAAGIVTLRPATAADATHLFEWRNDSDAIRWSATGRGVALAEHREWFSRALDDPARRIWIGERDGVALGMVRMDVRDAIGTVSIAVDPAHRGAGVGAALLNALTSALALDFQAVELRALVHPEHAASRRIFEHAGYAEIAIDPETGFCVLSRPLRRSENSGTPEICR